MNALPTVYIIILNWNGLDDTLECLESVTRLSYSNYKILVIDNASTDNSVHIIRNSFPQIEMIVNNENLGFTGGNNIGIKYALNHGADYVWLLNNDTVVPYNCLEELISDTINCSNIGLISPVIKFFENPSTIQFAGSIINWQTMDIYYPENKNNTIPYNRNRKDVCVWGTALLINVKLINKIGYLNKDMFAYWEDTEYSLRSLKAGFINTMSDNAVIYHKHQISEVNAISKSKYYYYFMNRNRWILMRSIHLTMLQHIKFFRRGLGNLIKDISYCSQNKPQEHLDACFNGYWHGLLNIKGPILNAKPMPLILKLTIKILFCSFYSFLLANIVSGDYCQAKSIIRNKIFKFQSSPEGK